MQDFEIGEDIPLNVGAGLKRFDSFIIFDFETTENDRDKLFNIGESLANWMDNFDSRVGVITYNQSCTIDMVKLPLTTDHDALHTAISQLSQNQYNLLCQPSDLSSALLQAQHLFTNSIQARKTTRKLIFVISHGIDSNPSKAIDLANEIKKDGTLIVTIGLSNNSNNNFLKSIASLKCSANYDQLSALSHKFQSFLNSIFNDTDVTVSLYFNQIYKIGEAFNLKLVLRNLRPLTFYNISIEFFKDSFIKGTAIEASDSLNVNEELEINCCIELQDGVVLRDLVRNCSLQFVVMSDEKELFCTHNRVYLSPFMFMKNIALFQSKYTKGIHFLVNGSKSSGKGSLINLLHRIFSQREDKTPAIVGTTNDSQPKTLEISNYRIEKLTSIPLNNYIQLKDKWGYVVNENDEEKMKSISSEEIMAFKYILNGNGKPGHTLGVSTRFTFMAEPVVPDDIVDVVLLLIDCNDIIPSKEIKEDEAKYEEFKKRKHAILDVIGKKIDTLSLFNGRQYAIVVTKTDTLPNVSSLDFFNPDSDIHKQIIKVLTSNSSFAVDPKRVYCLSNEVSGENDERWMNEIRQGVTVMRLIENIQKNHDATIKRIRKDLFDLRAPKEIKQEKTELKVRFSFDQSRFDFASKFNIPGIRRKMLTIHKNEEKKCIEELKKNLFLIDEAKIRFKIEDFIVAYDDLFSDMYKQYHQENREVMLLLSTPR